MEQSTNSPWRTPATEYSKPQYGLQHTVSMVNLHEEAGWYATRGPASPTASSASSTSRTTTPTTTNNNPWSNMVASPGSNSTQSNQSAGSSPRDSPNHTPQYPSRSTTPVAPQPIRPYNAVAGFAPLSPALSPSGDSFKGFEYPGPQTSAFPGSPNPYRQPAAPLTPLVNGFINTSVLSSQGQSLSGWFYELCRKQGWDAGLVRKIWQWTLSNPKVAILLFVCDDVASWRQAAFFDLRDESLPFPEDRLQGIVADAHKLVAEQWRATSKELPLTGGHVDYAVRETVPLQHVRLIRTSRNSEKSVDRVRVLGGSSDDRVLVRKRFITTRPSQKAAVLEQIKKFQQYEHNNIAKIFCSYAQPNHVGIITEKAQYSLDDYLALPGNDSSRSKLLVDWMYDLASALDYLHSQSTCHRSIRPRKILIDGSRIFYAAFDIGHNSGSFSPTLATSQRLDQLQTHFQDQAYIYAAPEAIVSRGKRMADVFSLGCVLLSMMTVAQNQSLSSFTQYRAGSTQDASFHAHLDRVGSWRNRLHAASTSSLRNGNIGSGRRLRQLKAEAEWLSIIEKMLLPRPKERIKMSFVLASVSSGKVTATRRRSLDGGGYSGQVAASLDENDTTTTTTTPTTTTTTLIDLEPERVATVSENTRKPELSVFDGYFQKQSRRLEPAGGW